MDVENTSGLGSGRGCRSRGRRWALLALALATTLAPAAARATEVTWLENDGGIGSWSNPARWWPSQLPAAGDLVWVKASAGSTVWVNYASPDGPWLDTAHFDSVGSGLAIVTVSQDVLRAGKQNVGLTGRGHMAVTGGGTHQVHELNLGFWAGSEGTYNLNTGGTLIAGQLIVGLGGRGTFRHLAGTGTVDGDLVLGFLNGASGTYELEPSAQLSAGRLLVGDGGVGVMRHSGSALSLPGSLTLGVFGTGNGRYELSDGGSVDSAELIVGGGGRGVFLQDGSDLAAVGNCIVGFLGTGNGTYEVSGPSTIHCGSLVVGGGGIGRFTQYDGASTAQGDLIVGSLGTGNGTVELFEGQLGASREFVGSFGVGHFDHSAGRNDADLLQLGSLGGWGSYVLSEAGVLEVGTLILGGFGAGEFVQTGGTATVAGQVRIGELAGSASTLALDDGAFSAGSIWNKADGELQFNGGSLVAGNFTNDGHLQLSGDGIRWVDSPVTNNGRVDAVETSVAYPGPFTHRGQYWSTASDNQFVDLVVDDGGIVVADAASRLAFNGDLRLELAGPSWETSEAELAFLASADGTHLLRQPGQDLGPTADGYLDNYAWGRLTLESGEALALECRALYVHVLDVEDGLPQLASIESHGHNIYYDASAPDNDYLGGETHALAGGGQAIPVPEPSVALGLVVGALVLARLPRSAVRPGGPPGRRDPPSSAATPPLSPR